MNDREGVTIYEIIAANNLASELLSSSNLALRVSLQRTSCFRNLVSWEAELSAVVMVLSQLLVSNVSSLTEMFYGIKRILNSENINSSKVNVISERELPLLGVKFSLLFSAVLPYLQSKIHGTYLKAKEMHALGNLLPMPTSSHVLHKCPNNISTSKMKFFVLSYPIFSCLYEGMQFIEILKFVLKESKFYGVVNRALRIQLIRSDASSTLRQNLCLSVGAVGFKFVSFWLNRDRSRLRIWEDRLILPLSPMIERDFARVQFKSQTSNCPLCRKKLVNPSVLTVSGYIFCFDCISSHLLRYGNCPIRGTQVSNYSDKIRRIFVSNEKHS